LALALPAGAWLKNYQALAAPLLGAVKITAVKALQLDFQTDGCLVRIETDAGVTGYGETGVDAKMARARIPQLHLVGGDALAIERHFLAMTGAIHPFVPSIPLISVRRHFGPAWHRGPARQSSPRSWAPGRS
jgi:hypothetical protein